jgi:hypothetical protein
MSPLVSTLHDAAVSPEAWPLAPKVLTEAMNVGGAALIIANKTTGRVDDACFFGLSAEFKLDYLERYAALDPYSPLLDRSWKKLSECLPESLLRKNEWYNDFILTCGVRDILGTRITDTPNHSASLGFHQQIGRPFSERVDSIMNLVAIPLRQATQRHTERFSSPKPGLLDQSRTEVSAGENRYYFHVGNGTRYPDETGTIFPTSEDAVAHAFVLARELAPDATWHGCYVFVVTELGDEICCVPIGW